MPIRLFYILSNPFFCRIFLFYRSSNIINICTCSGHYMPFMSQRTQTLDSFSRQQIFKILQNYEIFKLHDTFLYAENIGKSVELETISK